MARNGGKFPPTRERTSHESFLPLNSLTQITSLLESFKGRWRWLQEEIQGQEDKDADDTLHLLLENKTSDAKNPIAVGADLGYDQNCKQVVEQVVENFGRIDILVNNAAEQHKTTSLDELTEDRLDRVFRNNIFSQFFLCRHALKHMKEGGTITNTTSVNAYTGNPKVLDYTSTKGAIVSFTRALALQLVQKGIRVNGVAPGLAAQPYEIAPSFVFLACDDSRYFTGQVLHPNGGMIVNA
uniref:Glucose/ribitol dehydrogenase n=1 Tax=Tanacetum cinerariifolium TaxID=118510 RepID=A0A6L2L090_TANCI|nr:glucose/ribitol dehydrogenase [Tanacetum cinerariifolium]